MPTDAPPSAPSATVAPGPVGALRLLAAFLREQADPEQFYGLLARDSVALVERHVRLGGSRVVDVGGGAGYFAAAFRERGAQCLLVEPDSAELYSRGDPGRASVIGDGYWLPLADSSVASSLPRRQAAAVPASGHPAAVAKASELACAVAPD